MALAPEQAGIGIRRHFTTDGVHDHVPGAELAARNAEVAAANALVSGKTSADQELSTFYKKVVPSGLDAAQRMTYSRLPALARNTNVKFENRRSAIDPQAQKNSRLGRLKTQLVFCFILFAITILSIASFKMSPL